MKSFSVFLVFILTAFPVVAQTDTNAVVVPADTNTPVASTAAGTVMPTNASATAVAMAPNSTVREMSLVDCIQEALQHNFGLQIGRYGPQISLYNLRASYSSYDPTFNLSGTHRYNTDILSTNGFNAITPLATNFVLFPRTSSKQNSFSSDLGASLPWGLDYDFVANLQQNYGINYFGTTNLHSFPSKDTAGSAEVDLTQHLLKDFWIDTTRLNIRVAKNRLKFTEQTLRGLFIDTITKVENAYYELIFARENVQVQQEALDLAQTQLDQDRQRVQIGTLAQLDVQQDEAQVAEKRASLIAAQFALATAQNSLKGLITDQYVLWHDTDIYPTETITNAPLQLFDLQDSWNKGLTGRPDILQARLDAERQGIQLKFDRNQLFPTLDLVGSYGYAGASRDYDGTIDEVGRGDRPYYTYGARLSYPLGNIGARNGYKDDKVTEKQLLLNVKQLEQGIMVEIDNQIKNAQSTYESVGATRQARIYAEAALDAEQKKYAVGKSTTFFVLQLQNTLTADRGNEIRALASYYQALANLAAAEGSTLERHHITVEAR